jgi:hypothetical protein
MLVVDFAVNDLLTVSPRGNLPYGFQGRASGMGREREIIERDCVTEAGITTRTTSGERWATVRSPGRQVPPFQRPARLTFRDFDPESLSRG